MYLESLCCTEFLPKFDSRGCCNKNVLARKCFEKLKFYDSRVFIEMLYLNCGGLFKKNTHNMGSIIFSNLNTVKISFREY